MYVLIWYRAKCARHMADQHAGGVVASTVIAALGAVASILLAALGAVASTLKAVIGAVASILKGALGAVASLSLVGCSLFVVFDMVLLAEYVVVRVPVPCVALAVVVRPISAPSAASRRRPPPPVALLMSLPLGGRRTNSKHGPHTY